MTRSSGLTPTMPATGLTLERYFPYYIIAIANRWTSSSSRLYLKRFGIGIVEWRVLASLGSRGQASSLDVVTMVGSDPASVSKAMRALERLGLVGAVRGRFAGRTKPYELSAEGAHMFERVRDLALERERLLLDGLTDSEQRQFLALLAKVHARLPLLGERPAEATD